MIADCPRRLSGLPKAVAVTEAAETSVAPVQHTQKRVRFEDPNRNISYERGRSKSPRPRGGRPPYSKFNKHIAHVWEDETGNVHVEELSDEEEAPPAFESETDTVEHITHGINTVDLQPECESSHSQSEFLHGSFLGL